LYHRRRRCIIIAAAFFCFPSIPETVMKIKAIIHKESDCYWAEFPALPGCFTQGDTYDELMRNIPEAIDCYLGEDNVQCDRPAGK